MEQFFDNVKAQKLAPYTFIEPRYYSNPSKNLCANDQHPPHSVYEGEKLIAEVYNTLFVENKSLDTVLLLTWDEHGGFYDHVPPPYLDEERGHNEYLWSRLGVRVPTILVSPYLSSQIINRTMEHCCIPKTVCQHFLGMDGRMFNNRVKMAKNFMEDLNWDPIPRQVEKLIPVQKSEPIYTGDHFLNGWQRSMYTFFRKMLMKKIEHMTAQNASDDKISRICVHKDSPNVSDLAEMWELFKTDILK